MLYFVDPIMVWKANLIFTGCRSGRCNVALRALQFSTMSAEPMTDSINLKCSHCDTSLLGEFCHQCGQAKHLHRIDGHFVWHELMHVLHLEKGIFYTIRELLLRPSVTIRSYLHEDRSRLVKPLLFLILCSLAYSLVGYFWPMPAPATAQTQGASAAKIWAWVSAHFGYANFLMSIPIALCLKAMFWRQRYNVFEIWVTLAYVMGLVMLFLSILPPLRATNLQIPHLTDILRILSLLYVSVAVASCFEGPRVLTTLKTAVAYVLGMFVFSGLVSLIGWGMDQVH